MRIYQLEESLVSIQDEDESLLKDTSKKELDIRQELDSELLVNSENKRLIEELNYIKSIKDSKFRFIYFLFPFIEVPISIVIFIMNIITGATIFSGILINVFAGILLLDSTHNISSNYRIASNEESIIKRVTKNIRLLFMNKRKFTKELEHYLEIDELSNNKIDELTAKLNSTISEKESLIDELEYLEGYIMGVQKIISRNLIEDMPENNLAVEFVNLRLNKKSSYKC